MTVEGDGAGTAIGLIAFEKLGIPVLETLVAVVVVVVAAVAVAVVLGHCYHGRSRLMAHFLLTRHHHRLPRHLTAKAALRDLQLFGSPLELALGC